MKLSLQWLYDVLGYEIPEHELIQRITEAGLEVDVIEPVAKSFQHVIVGEIKAIEPHPDAKKLIVTQVDIGDEILQIVCGANNPVVGAKVAVATVGATIGEDFRIKKTLLRGVPSHGMLCSATELGLAESSEGILILPADAPNGKDIKQYLQLNDKMITIELTPNRGDCLSLNGLARDIAAIFGKHFQAADIPTVAATHKETFPVTIVNTAACSHYVGRVIHNIDLSRPSPLWLQERLRRSGIRSIDAVVDVTNYVMLELGQPLHAFDRAQLNGKIIVRMAEADETLTLLSGEEVKLSNDVLVIADEKHLLGIAGIMGGKDSGVSLETNTIFLESAFFEPTAVSGRARRYGLTTDSSHRFERGVDPALQKIAIERATTLLIDFVGGEAGPVIESPTSYTVAQHEISLQRSHVNRLLGVHISDNEITTTLTHLGMVVTTINDSWHVKIPSYRFDLRIAEDLIEEIARIHGYDRIVPTMPVAQLQVYDQSEKHITKDALQNYLIANGYSEIITYSFIDPALQKQCEPTTNAVKLLNPISADMAEMRLSLLPGLLNVAQYNQNRQQGKGKIFEIGNVYHQANKGHFNHTLMLAGLVWGLAQDEQWGLTKRDIDFFDVKGDVEGLLALTGNTDSFAFQPIEQPALHPGQSASIMSDGNIVGKIGALHPKLAENIGISLPIFYFELNLALFARARLPIFAKLSKYPSIRRDLAIVVGRSVAVAQILATVTESIKKWLIDINLFDIYLDENSPDKKSVALSILLQHPERTLVDDEVNDIFERVVAVLEKKFDAELRG